MSEQPLISVLMGVYYQKDDVHLLERSVQSVLSQTHEKFELIICDGGSSERGKQFLEALAEKDDRIVLLRDDSLPTDLASKLNACLAHARGAFIARMDDDDYSFPQRFAVQSAYLDRHPETAFVGSNVRFCRDGCIVGQSSLPEFPDVRDFYFTQPYIHPALMFRKAALAQVGGYSQENYCMLCEDYDLLLRLYAAGCCGSNIQQNLLDYTIPSTAKGKRKMIHRWNESVTRFLRFRDLGCLHEAWPYVMKPLAVGLLPEFLLSRLKKKRQKS